MAQEQAPSAEINPPEWVQTLSLADRVAYDQARQENIDEMLPDIRIIIDNCLPGLKEERPAQFEATALEWAKARRDTYEEGMQAGKDIWKNSSDPNVGRFMRNVVGNWAG